MSPEVHPMRRRRAFRLWFLAGCTALAAAVVWVLAVLVLPEDSWLRPGQVTAFGMLVMVGFIVTALVLEAREAKRTDQDRVNRRRKRRQRRDVESARE
jgi:hypothetical protein